MKSQLRHQAAFNLNLSDCSNESYLIHRAESSLALQNTEEVQLEKER